MGRMRTVVHIGEPGMTVYEIWNIKSMHSIKLFNKFMLNDLKYTAAVGQKSFDAQITAVLKWLIAVMGYGIVGEAKMKCHVITYAKAANLLVEITKHVFQRIGNFFALARQAL